ncbi:MAG: transporter substrate-binding domain-containing protein [Coriobacteriales bacterium]|jgi:polar amino acid transport system substrate-binding protein|nr:transporter substrate-binding domain-containing protein [Coriobacteriales bacterium]
MSSLSKSRKALAVVASAILALSIVLVGCTSSPSDAPAETKYKLVKNGVLTVASDCDYPPFIFLEGDRPNGFEYELMQAVAGKLGLELEYTEPQNFDTILSQVAAGTKADIGVSSFTITEERKQLVDFCKPYCDSNQAVVVRSNSEYTDYSELAGLAVSAQSGTTGADWAAEFIPGVSVKNFNATTDAVIALRTGDVEAAIYDAPIAAYHVTTTYTDCKILVVVPTAEQYGIAVSKSNPELRDAVNQALVDLKADGTFDSLFYKYFPDLTAPVIK